MSTVIVCGGRDYVDDVAVFYWLDQFHAARPFTRLIHGAARGADSIAGAWARERGVPFQAFRADWNKHGRRAGPIRNTQMLDVGKPELVIAFPGGSGTRDMVQQGIDRDGVSVAEVGFVLVLRNGEDRVSFLCHAGRVEIVDGDDRSKGWCRMSRMIAVATRKGWLPSVEPAVIFSSDLTENPWADVLERHTVWSCPSSEQSTDFNSRAAS